MVQRNEIAAIYVAGVIQGVALVTFPAASAVFTSASAYDLSSTEYGAMFVPQAITAIGSALLRVNRLAFVAGSPHHYLSILLSPNRSRVLMSQTAAELQTGDGLAIAHDVRREATNRGAQSK